MITASRKLAFPKRLKQIFEEICKIIEKYSPDVIALEDIFFGKNFSSAVKIGEVRGIAILAATNYNIEVFEYSPATVKKSVIGYGTAAKSQIQKMVINLLNLKELPAKDASDALAVAICHSHTLKRRVIASDSFDFAQGKLHKQSNSLAGRLRSLKSRDCQTPNLTVRGPQ